MATGLDMGPERVAELDSGDMLGAVAGLGRQVRRGYDGAHRALAAAGSSVGPESPEALVVCGMGGSAIGADLVLACLPGLALPAVVVRGYELPAWVGPGALVVAVSYSGETEETLACASQARGRGCAPVCVASGGTLAAFAKAEGLPLVPVPGGGQPRAAVGSLSTAVLATIEVAGLCPAQASDVAAAATQLEADNALLGPETAEAGNPAKSLARSLHRQLAAFYGAGPTGPVARRWKGQVNENAKAPAFFNELPELDHNELMGWTSLPHVSAATRAVFLVDDQGDPRLARRAALTAAEYERLGVAAELVSAHGDSALTRLFSLVQLGDFASFYLALLYGVDPTPVDAIQSLKARLAGDGD